MMESDIITLINAVGFPIVAFLLMFWQQTRTISQNTKAINELVSYLKR